MPDITPNLGLKKPLGTETVSRATYNENLEIMDANAVKKGNGIAELTGGTLADRPAAGVAGRYYFAQDTGEIYLDTGTAWVLAAAGREDITALQEGLDAHQADETQHVPYAVASGSANTYAVTLSPTPTSLVAGMALAVKINVDSTGASTININGLGAKGIKKANGTDVTNLKANGIYTLRYDGTNFTLQGSDAAGNATPADILSGKTATTDAGEITGTIPSKSAQTYTPTTTNQVISAGQYLSGAQTVRGDANLLAANILSGKSIFGVAGNAVDGSGMKKFASGTISRGSTTYSIQGYHNTSSSTYDKYVVTVSGLTFTPSTILVVDRTSSYTKPVIYQAAGVIKTANNNLHYICDEYYSYVIADAPMYVNSTGFCLPVGYTNTYYWYAFE